MQPDPTKGDRVQVVVVGATVAGECAARWLAESGVRILLTGPRPGTDLGLMHCGLAETPTRLRDALGSDRFAELTAFARRSPALVEAEGADGLWVASAPGEDALMAPSARALVQAGVPARVVDGPELAARGVRAECGFAVQDEALVEPDAQHAAILARAAAAGAELVLDAVPRAIAAGPDALTVDLGGRTVETEMVILTDGRSAVQLVSWLSELFLTVREQALLAEGSLARVVGRAGHGYTWFRPWGEGVAVGGSRWATPHLEIGETVTDVVPVIQSRLEAFARDRLGLGAVGHRWAWIDTHTCDGLPIVGPIPGDGRIVVCAGMNGNEWGLGPAAARAVVDGVLGGPTGTPAMFSPSRFVG